MVCRISAILVADVVRYRCFMKLDVADTMTSLKAHRQEL